MTALVRPFLLILSVKVALKHTVLLAHMLIMYRSADAAKSIVEHICILALVSSSVQITFTKTLLPCFVDLAVLDALIV